MRRILSLPHIEPASVRDLRRRDSTAQLWDVQRHTLGLLRALPGPRAPIGMVAVGEGKSLIALLAAAAKGCTRPLIMTDPQLVKQMKRDCRAWAKHYHIVQPEIRSYGQVSQQRYAHFLHEFRPDIIIADEAHGLRLDPSNPSARTRRVISYIVENPDTVFMPLSGSFAECSIDDYAHLMELALRDWTPLPIDDDERGRWASVLDPEKQSAREEWAELHPLRVWSGERSTRAAYRKRLGSAPGVVSSTKSRVQIPLVLRGLHIRPTEPVQRALDDLGNLWEDPDGRMLVEATEINRHAKTLSLGFWLRSDVVGDPDDVLEWREARKGWGAALRDAVLYASQVGRDTPGLWEQATREGHASPSMIKALHRWDAIKGSCRQVSETVWIDDRPFRAYLRTIDPDALVWYGSLAVAEALREEGWTVYGAGEPGPRKHTGPTAVSVHVHRKGWDGAQRLWSRQVFLETGSSAKRWEQALGRLHRPGQRADVVETVINQSTPPLRKALDRAIARSLWVEESHGQPRKLNYATWANPIFFDYCLDSAP